MRKVKYPENIDLKKHLKRGDLKLIARASHKSEELIKKVFSGTRKMKPEVRRVYEIVVRLNSERESVLMTDKKPNV
jgi:hypothetical protein